MHTTAYRSNHSPLQSLWKCVGGCVRYPTIAIRRPPLRSLTIRFLTFSGGENGLDVCFSLCQLIGHLPKCASKRNTLYHVQQDEPDEDARLHHRLWNKISRFSNASYSNPSVLFLNVLAFVIICKLIIFTIKPSGQAWTFVL